MSAFGCFGVAAVTSLTYQNTTGVFGAEHQPREVVGRQLKALFDDFPIAAIKTGMLPTREVIEEVAAAVASRPAAPLLVDPVIRSTSGYDLIDDGASRALIEKLFPLASVVTPNIKEAEQLTGLQITDLHGLGHAAEAILAMGARAVLIKGGDRSGEEARDFLMDAEGSLLYSAKKIPSTNTHGTGCTLSSALACLLAMGYSLRQAVPVAKKYVVEAIRTAPGLGSGFGPLNHFPPEFGMEQ
jgi:hydroxymethylpyrimidine kinase/phosphomethylpyrimidine kinase